MTRLWYLNRVGIERRRQRINPASISGLNCWYDFSLLSTLYQDAAKTVPVVADGDSIGACVNRVAGGADIIESVASSRLTYKANIQNGLAMGLGLGGDCLYGSVNTNHGVGTGNFLMMMVIRPTTMAASWANAFWSNGNNAPALYIRSDTQNKVCVYWSSAQYFAGSLSINTTYLIELWRNTGKIYLAVNGVQDITSLSVATSMANNKINVISDQAAAGVSSGVGYAGEMCFWTGYPTSNITDLRKYFNSKWAIY